MRYMKMNESEPLKKCRKRKTSAKSTGHHLVEIRIIPEMLIICGTALRWHEHVLGFCVKHGNLQVNENRKSASHRTARLKVEK